MVCLRLSSKAHQCVACRGSVSFFGGRREYSYFICNDCGTLQLFPMPEEAEIAKLYETEYARASHYEADAEKCACASRPYYESIRNTLLDHSVSGAILDCGSGWGGLCRFLIENGYHCRGVEPSAEMASYCRMQGLPVLKGGLEAAADERFAAIVLCAVFEHLTSHELFLKRAFSLLRPGGLLISLQPTARFAATMGLAARIWMRHAPLPRLHQVFSPPWHTVLFSLEGMERIAGRNGFLLLEIRPAPQGKSDGISGGFQRLLGLINKMGVLGLGVRWPFLVAHTFVFKRPD